MSEYQIGVIGGSGLYEMERLQLHEERRIETPFGDPSDQLILGEIDDRRVAFLPRHGRGHRLLPSELNFRANIYAMKVLGVEWIISISAVGSLKDEYAPKDIVVPDQFYDRTRHRPTPSSATAWSGTSGLPIRSAHNSPESWRTGRKPQAPECIEAAPTCAWKDRSSRPERSPRKTVLVDSMSSE